jgi:hypothetical protein
MPPKPNEKVLHLKGGVFNHQSDGFFSSYYPLCQIFTEDIFNTIVTRGKFTTERR